MSGFDAVMSNAFLIRAVGHIGEMVGKRITSEVGEVAATDLTERGLDSGADSG